mgnify:CR=1 FL=1
MQYDEAADRRSWHALEEFLAEVLKQSALRECCVYSVAVDLPGS